MEIILLIATLLVILVIIYIICKYNKKESSKQKMISHARTLSPMADVKEEYTITILTNNDKQYNAIVLDLKPIFDKINTVFHTLFTSSKIKFPKCETTLKSFNPVKCGIMPSISYEWTPGDMWGSLSKDACLAACHVENAYKWICCKIPFGLDCGSCPNTICNKKCKQFIKVSFDLNLVSGLDKFKLNNVTLNQAGLTKNTYTLQVTFQFLISKLTVTGTGKLSGTLSLLFGKVPHDLKVTVTSPVYTYLILNLVFDTTQPNLALKQVQVQKVYMQMLDPQLSLDATGSYTFPLDFISAFLVYAVPGLVSMANDKIAPPIKDLVNIMSLVFLPMPTQVPSALVKTISPYINPCLGKDSYFPTFNTPVFWVNQGIFYKDKSGKKYNSKVSIYIAEGILTLIRSEPAFNIDTISKFVLELIPNTMQFYIKLPTPAGSLYVIQLQMDDLNVLATSNNFNDKSKAVLFTYLPCGLLLVNNENMIVPGDLPDGGYGLWSTKIQKDIKPSSLWVFGSI